MSATDSDKGDTGDSDTGDKQTERFLCLHFNAVLHTFFVPGKVIYNIDCKSLE